MADITRRDLLHGSALLALSAGTLPAVRAQSASPYPPSLTGLRGSHEGSYETAHALAREGREDFGELAGSERNDDLIVVGGGVSGLAAAYFYRQSKPDARILILDNHDDFGGHAKRNEFVVDGKSIIGYGGSQTMESPSSYSEVAKRLLRELAVDLDAFDTAYDQEFYKRHGLTGGFFFDRETYGESAFVPNNFVGGGGFLGLADAPGDHATAIAQMPLDADSRNQLLHLVTGEGDAVEDVSLSNLSDYLSSISYEQLLTERLGVHSPALLNLLSKVPAGYFGVGIDAITALEGVATGMPGGRHLGVPGFNWLLGLMAGLADPYIHHFPDGNASIARLLVRSLIPSIANATAPAELVTSRFAYGELDRAEHATRIRLSSTVVNVQQSGDKVTVRYVRNGRQYEAQANHAVLACYNGIIPHICPALPEKQKAALREQVKSPLVYTNVALRNWRAIAERGVGLCFAPNMFHNMMMLDFPVSIGDYRFSPTPDEPVVVHLSSAFGAPGLPPKDQFRIGRARLLGTSYAQIEADTFNFLDQLLGPAGFKSSTDVAAVTVNRWPHGYAYGAYTLFDPEYAEGQAPHEIGRQTRGNIAIANSDAGARAYLDEAIDQAYRAVGELVG